jgi:hypothetical protein
MVNILLWIIVGLILGGAVLYIIRAKKKGVKCIGCPAGATCSGKCNGNCGNCNEHHAEEF